MNDNFLASGFLSLRQLCQQNNEKAFCRVAGKGKISVTTYQFHLIYYNFFFRIRHTNWLRLGRNNFLLFWKHFDFNIKPFLDNAGTGNWRAFDSHVFSFSNSVYKKHFIFTIKTTISIVWRDSAVVCEFGVNGFTFFFAFDDNSVFDSDLPSFLFTLIHLSARSSEIAHFWVVFIQFR